MTVLSKSKILAFKQCPKRLWLEVHAPGIRIDSKPTMASFDTGNKIGEIARQIIAPDGNSVYLNYKELGLKGLIAATPAALAKRKPVFEAGFQAIGALSLADALLPVESSLGPSWHMVEVKSSTSVHDYHRVDAAVQHCVATATGLNISKVSIAHVDNSWTYPGGDDYQGLLKLADITDEVAELIPQVPEWLSEAHEVVKLTSAPGKATGSHCFDPFECGFLQHCTSSEPQVDHPVSWLPRVQAKTLKAYIADHLVHAMEDVPDDMLNDMQRRVKACTLSGETYFDAEGAQADLAQYSLPAYFLDFETINPGLPIWAGTRPYEQIPFQFSCHVLDAQRNLTHKEFLLPDGSNPIRPFGEALVKACGVDGPIYVYNKGFEGSRINDLARHAGSNDQLSDALLGIKNRLVDLMPIAQARFYHPSQQGSWSIKKVLPAMFPNEPGLDYKNLEGVQDGGGAQQAFLSLIGKGQKQESADILRIQLLKYCELDTFAMVNMHSYLLESTKEQLMEVRNADIAADGFSINAAWEIRDRNKTICRWFVAWQNIEKDKLAGAIAGYSGGGQFEIERFYAVLNGGGIESLWIDYEDRISGEEIEFNSLDEQTLAICEGALDCIWKWNDNDKWGDTDEIVLIESRKSKLVNDMDMLYLSNGSNRHLRDFCEKAGLTAGPT